MVALKPRHKKFFRDNGLSICLFSLFLLSFTGQIVSGFSVSQQERLQDGEPAQKIAEYFVSGDLLEAVFENWESEFLQMGLYIMLTVFLYQRGSAESKDPDKTAGSDEDPRRHARAHDTPWPVKKGGVILYIYNHSLSLALFLLFFVSFFLHGIFGKQHYNEELIRNHEPTVSLMQYFGSSQFWFESFQNWQSEFLSIAMVVVLSIYLRQIGSPESKPVHYAHSKTGKE